MTISDLIFIIALVLLVFGTLSMFAGLFILITRIAWGDLKEIAQQTAKIAQKGITEEIAGLVGNASNLITALNKLVGTATGVGVFLILFGGVLIGCSYLLASQL